MNRRRIAATAAAFTLAAALSGVTDASAKVVFGDSFEDSPRGRLRLGGEVVATPHGQGIRGPGAGKVSGFVGAIVDPVAAGLHSPGGMPAGTISLWVQRDEDANEESLLSFMGSDGDALGTVAVFWKGFDEDGDLEIRTEAGQGYPLWYTEYRDEGNGGVASRSALLPAGVRVAKGAWLNVALTWGPSPSDCGVYVNGQRVAAKVPKDFGLARLLADAQSILIGSAPWPQTLGGAPAVPEAGILVPGTVIGVVRSTIDAVEIHDTVVTDFPLVYSGSTAVRISGIESNRRRVAGFSGKLVAGNRVGVTMQGTPGGVATFDVAHYPDLGGRVVLDWRGWGVYLEEKTFYDKGEVNLREVEGYKVYADTQPFGDDPGAREPVAELEVGEQTYTFELLSVDTPYYLGVFAEMRDGTLRPVIKPRAGLAMTETAPGVYEGAFTVRYSDRFERAVLVGRLALGGVAASLAGGDDAFTVDPRLTVAVGADPEVLRADETSTAKVKVTVTDANGKGVSGHKVRFLLATTSGYTGVVGGGAFAEQVGGKMASGAFEGETDLFGRLTTTYVAGFAAKTAIIVARDMESNDTGAAAVKTYIQALAELQLDPVDSALAAEGYEVQVTSSDDWLTADGVSRARITATVTLRGQPVEGHEVAFSVSSGGGSVSRVSGTTDSSGRARAVYTAGKKIGVVVITATDLTVDVSGSVQIELRSDAPAKIAIRLTPDRLPADGRSRADLEVTVTDINDNPNDGAVVECVIEAGGGKLRDDSLVTDRRGEAGTTYVAGDTPGLVQISLTVRSAVPSEEEFDAARALALAVTDYTFF